MMISKYLVFTYVTPTKLEQAFKLVKHLVEIFNIAFSQRKTDSKTNIKTNIKANTTPLTWNICKANKVIKPTEYAK